MEIIKEEFDLSAFELDDSGTLTVRNATDTGELLGIDGKPVIIELYGPGSDVASSIEHQEAKAAAARIKKVFQGKADPDDDEKVNIAKFVRRTKSISANFPVSPEKLYSNRKLVYIHRQVERFLNDEANFSKASTTT